LYTPGIRMLFDDEFIEKKEEKKGEIKTNEPNK
jgi:hypothetical protein